MTPKAVRFERWHYEWLESLGPSAEVSVRVPEHVLAQLEQHDWWTVVLDSEPVACIGTFQHWPGRREAHAFLNPARTRRIMGWLTKAVREHLDRLEGRVEFTVRHDFVAGHKWARLLGFRCETPEGMAVYGPQGENHYLYARVR